MDYSEFIASKRQLSGHFGFDPIFMPDELKDFQKYLVEWALKKGRAAIFADCGLGKTVLQLVCAENIVRKTNKPVLIATPLAVSNQTVLEAEKFGMEAVRCIDGKIPSGARIIITNYERLHHFNTADFAACKCDESGILKNFNGSMRKQITEFMLATDYRGLYTATAAPNDYIELGTHSEALGYLKTSEMLARFFNHDGGETSKWRLKKHAEAHLFWRWVCGWARAVRTPSDLGFSDDGYILPPLNCIEHIVSAAQPRADLLFDMPAVTLDEQRDERRRTINERCELAASFACAHDKATVSWCHLNAEGDLLESLIPGAVQISGADADEFKEEMFMAFSSGQITKLVSKPTIAGFGLNWQHCSHQTFFPSHSFEQWYQAMRRSWRFGQMNPVTIDVIASEGERGVLANMNRKAAQASIMFARLVSLMNNELMVEKNTNTRNQQEAIPSWL